MNLGIVPLHLEQNVPRNQTRSEFLRPLLPPNHPIPVLPWLDGIVTLTSALSVRTNQMGTMTGKMTSSIREAIAPVIALVVAPKQIGRNDSQERSGLTNIIPTLSIGLPGQVNQPINDRGSHDRTPLPPFNTDVRDEGFSELLFSLLCTHKS